MAGQKSEMIFATGSKHFEPQEAWGVLPHVDTIYIFVVFAASIVSTKTKREPGTDLSFEDAVQVADQAPALNSVSTAQRIFQFLSCS